MSIAVLAHQPRMLSMPESSSVICADLPVRQESLDSSQMANAEGALWGWIVGGAAGLYLLYRGAKYLIKRRIEDAFDDPPLPACRVYFEFDFEENEAEVGIECEW